METATQEKTREAIEKRHGWDYCDHDRVRRFCPECKFEVPAFMRRGDPKHYLTAVPLEGDKDYPMMTAMLKYGGSFVKALANCLDHADPSNYAKLEAAFPEYCMHYREMAGGAEDEETQSGSDLAHEAEQEIAKENTMAAWERINNRE